MSDSIDIHSEFCCYSRCKQPRWEGHWHCLHHIVLDTLMEMGLVDPLKGRYSSALVLARHLQLRDHYIAFFRARASALARGDITPVKTPVEAMAVATTVHPNPLRAFGIRLLMDHWLKLIGYIWDFDHRISNLLRSRRERRRLEQNQVLHTG